jgi:lipoprotein-anchoring transpeptidase ErfK/SrfK
MGTFHINNKMTDQTLVGADEDKDGEPDYRSKVSYWMPFQGNSVGLHDAPWRSSFGGTIYQWNGSHGCINLPSQSAAELFSLVKVGDKVIVHT